MTFVIAGITVAQGATILNAILSFMQCTLGLALIALLVNIISNVHSAITWSVIGRELHSSLWPSLLRTDSFHGAAPLITWLSRLGIFSTILVAVAGVITPLGLKPGPLVTSHNFRLTNAVYVRDTSPLASATSSRSDYFYSRPCNFLFFSPCPGGTDAAETTEIDPSIIDQFNSTPYGPFNMQFRRYYKSRLLHRNDTSITKDNVTDVIEGQFSTLESLILRDGLFAVEGAIVDMSDTPGIGLTNHTMPTELKYGGTWSQEMLWLEPATACVDTNLTVDYVENHPGLQILDTPYLTDRGGFVNLPLTKRIPLDLGGQNIDLYQHAYVGAYLNNLYGMVALKYPKNNKALGMKFPINTNDSFYNYVNPTGTMRIIPLYSLSGVMDDVSLDIICSGYGDGDNVNITNVSVRCGIFLGPPYRVDGGDDRVQDQGSKWRQNLHVCASAVKASIQRVDYSLNGTAEFANLRVIRSPIDEPVLWAMEKTNMTINDVDIYWGRVADSYEFNPNLTTIRAKEFYIPASDMAKEQAHLAPEAIWDNLYSEFGSSGLVDYSGATNAALLRKYRSIISSDPAQGVARICNLIWTDIVANTLLGTYASAVLAVAENHPSITYDLKYGIPLILLIVIWLPVFTIALFLLASGKLKFSDIKNLLNHTSVGRIVTGYSALTVQNLVDAHESDVSIPLDSSEEDWAATAGRTLLLYKPNAHEDGPKEEIELLSRSTPAHDEGDSS